MQAAGLTPHHYVAVGGEAAAAAVSSVASPTVATLQEVVEASSHPSCPTACTPRVGLSTRVPSKGLTTSPGGTLEGARGPAASGAARDPLTK